LKPIVFPLDTAGISSGGCLKRFPHALGCTGWYTARVTTCAELDEAIKAAEHDLTAEARQARAAVCPPPLPAQRDLASRLISFGMETNKGDVMGKQARIGLLPGASAALLACRKLVTRSSRRQGTSRRQGR
jgi:hypothetical protein